MAITTLRGYTRACGRQSGGVSRIGIIEAANLKSVTVEDGVITAIEFEDGAKFKDYQSVLDQAEYKFANGEASLLIRLNRAGKASSIAHNELAEVIPCGVFALAQLNNGETALIGYTEEFGKERPIISFDSDSGSGKAPSDDNYFDITLKTTQIMAPLFLSETVDIATLF